MMNIDILPFTMDVYADVMELWRASEGIGLSSADSEDRIAYYLNRNPGMSFIAKADGRMIGAVLCGHDGRRGYLHHLAVDKAYRYHGIGQALVGKCLKALEEEGIQKCHLFLIETNLEGRKFWEKVGWSLRRDIAVMSKNLP
jgi:ribosomal protein S18 acetylase RimI-like enzyme